MNGVVLLFVKNLLRKLLIFISIIIFLLIYTFRPQPKNPLNPLDKNILLPVEINKTDDNLKMIKKNNMNQDSTIERKYEPDEFQAGVNFLVYEHPSVLNAQRLFKQLHNLGINSVAIVFPLYQSDWNANDIMISPISTPSLDEIKGLILSAHAEDLNVMLRPILDEKSIMASGHWRGTIKPSDPRKWFENYSSILIEYAHLAQETNVEIFNIGTEFNSLQQNEYSNEWFKIIREIRKVYNGKLTYSFNWDCLYEIPKINFVSSLDYIGIDAYFPLDAQDNATIEELDKAWNKWMTEVKSVMKNRSVIVTEAGMIPISGAYRTPYVWSIPGGKLDWQAQANYYESTFNAWASNSVGIYWWYVAITQPSPGEISYSPLGTPTEEIIKQIFLKQP